MILVNDNRENWAAPLFTESPARLISRNVCRRIDIALNRGYNAAYSANLGAQKALF